MGKSLDAKVHNDMQGNCMIDDMISVKFHDDLCVLQSVKGAILMKNEEVFHDEHKKIHWL